jgi:DNA-binding MarR family transcriptional regulator
VKSHDAIGDQVIIALRRVIRAVDLHSRTLVDSHGLTGSQALVLRVLQNGSLAAGKLASRVSLSQGTVTDILNRLEQRDWIKRVRDSRDRRRVVVRITAAGLAKLEKSPPPLQDNLIQRF